MHKKVKFKNEEYWLNDEGFGTMLSPLEHYSSSGELIADAFHDISYAVIEGEDIVRYGETIGNISELEEVKENEIL